jgi:H+/Cl- antiporter ClcA
MSKGSGVRGSTLVPWLFFGPLFAGVFGMVTHHMTGWRWAAMVAQISVAVLVLVIVAAFAQNFIRGAKQRDRPNEPD